MPRVGTIPIASISKRDMIDALTDIKEKNNAGMAERVRRYANTIFNWATSEDIIDVPPTYKLKARVPKKIPWARSQLGRNSQNLDGMRRVS